MMANLDFSHWKGDASFGSWETDAFGCPSYLYSSGRSPLPRTTEPGLAHSPWHQVGNLRVTATVHEAGFVQLYNSDRGLCCITPRQPLLRSPGGAVLYIRPGGGAPELPGGILKPVHARFGLGYAELLYASPDISVRLTHWLPHDDAPALITDIEMSSNVDCSIGLIFSTAYYFIGMEPVCTGTRREKFMPPPLGDILSFATKYLVSPLKLTTDHRRSTFASSFKYSCKSSGGLAVVSPHKPGVGKFKPARTTDKPSHPMSFFCNAPDTAALSFNGNNKLFSSQLKLKSFNAPQNNAHADFESDSPVSLSCEFPVASQSVKASHRVIWGYCEESEIESCVSSRAVAELKSAVSERAKSSVRFSIPGIPWGTREWMWHGDYLRGAAFYDGYVKTHIVRQGSAYYFIQGLDGAPRDHALFAVPLTYIDPPLAREIIRFSVRTLHEDGRIPYGFTGYGKSAGFGLHDEPSDLPLFFLWALAEYVFATRDFAFLDELNKMYESTRASAISVKEAAQLVWRFFRDKIGVGEHGLVKVGSGDWNDPLQWHVSDRSVFLKKGESVYNTAMAAYVLPRAASLFSTWDEHTASQISEYADSLRAALQKQWNGRWLYRAWDGKGNPLGDDSLYLEHHAWALVAGALEPEQRDTLIREIYEKLDSPSPIGAAILNPPKKLRFNIIPGGWDTNGGIWHATNMLLSWGYARGDRQLALQSLLKNTLCAHAEAYPEIWHGIWTGPDAYNSFLAPDPGETYHHITPMADYPAMNSNAHANPITAAIKLCGIEPTLDGFNISPLIPGDEFSIDTNLVALTRAKHSLSFRLTAQSQQGQMSFTVEDPLCAEGVLVTSGGEPVVFERISPDAIKIRRHPQSGGIFSWTVHNRG